MVSMVSCNSVTTFTLGLAPRLANSDVIMLPRTSHLAPGSASQPQSNGPAQGTSAASDNNICSHCIIAAENNSFHNWDAGLQFLSDKEISGKLFDLRDFTFTSALLVGKDRTKFASCMKKVLVIADIFQDSIRARDTLRHLARRGIVTFNFSPRNLTQVTSTMKPEQDSMFGFSSLKRITLREGLY